MPQRGHHGATRWSWTSRPFSWICFSDHQTDCDVLGVHGAVGVVHVDPVAHARRQLGEGVGVPGDGLAAAGVELGDAVVLDVLLAVEAQLALHGELDGQPVAVPSGLARHVVPAHRAEAREDVLEDAGLDVVGAGHAVGGRRPLVEDPLGAALGLLEGTGEDLVVPPEVEHGVLEGGQVDLGWHLAVLRHRNFLRRTSQLPSEGRERLPERRRTRGTTLLGSGLPAAPSLRPRSRFYSHRGPVLSSGGSGVIFTSRRPPGSHRPRVARGCSRTLLVPFIACR